MRIVEINDAEAIIEPFWDGGTSNFNDRAPRYCVWDEYEKTVLNGAIVKEMQSWAFATIQLEYGEGDKEFYQIERNCDINISEYDTFILFASIPQTVYFRLEAVIDGKEELLGDQVWGRGDTFEFNFPLTGSILTGLKLVFGSQADSAVLNLEWFGLADSGRLKRLLSKRSPYSPVWPGFFKEPEEAVLSPQTGLLFGEDDLEGLRRKMKSPLFNELYEEKRRKAEEDRKRNPEELIGRTVPYLDRRWSRTRETEDVRITAIMENLAFVALIENDYDMMRTACRYAISAAHCEYWCESVMGIFPGATWHHRSFTETAYCKSCALVLDWGGGLLTPHAKQVIQDAIVMKGLPRLESDFKRMDYIREMNQGVVFSEGRIFAYLALMPDYPRYRSNLEEAERDAKEIIGNYIQQDGGTSEGPHYWMFTFKEIMPAFYALARQRGVPFSYYRSTFAETGKFALSMLSVEEEGTAILPVNDAHPGVHMACSLAYSFYEFTGDERWLRMYRRLLRKGLVDPDTFSMIISPDRETGDMEQTNAGQDGKPDGSDESVECPEGSEGEKGEVGADCPKGSEYGRIFPVTGQLGSLRKGEKFDTHLHLCSGRAFAGHYHQDKGSLILEADGMTVCPDCGCGNYHDADLLTLTYPYAHSLLLPVYQDKRLVRQSAGRPGGTVLEAWDDGQKLCFFTDETGSWDEGHYKKITRRIYSRKPEVFLVEDEYQLDEAGYVEFLLNCYAEFSVKGQRASAVVGRLTLTVIPVNWNWEEASVRRFEDGNHRPVWQLAAKAPERAGRLQTMLALTEGEPYEPEPYESEELLFGRKAEFRPENSGKENSAALQRMFDQAGTIRIGQPGIYEIEDTLIIRSHTCLIFGEGVWLKRSAASKGSFAMTNQGAFDRGYDTDITIKGMNLITGGVEARTYAAVYGLTGELSFFYVKGLRIFNFTCLDLPPLSYGIHVCTFEDLIIEDVHIEGRKDAVHLGTGKQFVIRRGLFKTFDDPVALNAHDYAVANPQMGWIEDGLIEDCTDCADEDTTGYFCRILAGAWCDWYEGMKIQNSDTVVSHGRVYRAFQRPDGQLYSSVTAPSHEKGMRTIDGINWVMVQENIVYQCGCRNIHFKNIQLKKRREVAFSIHFDHDRYSRSIYPGAAMPLQENLTFEGIRQENEIEYLLRSITPMDHIRLLDSTVNGGKILLEVLPGEEGNYPGAQIYISGTVPERRGPEEWIECDGNRTYELQLR